MGKVYTRSKHDTYATTRKLSIDFDKLDKITDKWGYLRQVYMENIPEILHVANGSKTQWAQVYHLDWPSFFSPIERIAWGSIRDLGYIVLYPQFPLFNYFIDFANPFLKIGLELDGQEYHNPVKDRERDQMLAEYGWKIFRVSGAEAHTRYMNISEIEERDVEGVKKQEMVEHWLLNTCDGVIFALRYWYFLNDEEKEHYGSIDLSIP